MFPNEESMLKLKDEEIATLKAKLAAGFIAHAETINDLDMVISERDQLAKELEIYKVALKIACQNLSIHHINSDPSHYLESAREETEVK